MIRDPYKQIEPVMRLPNDLRARPRGVVLSPDGKRTTYNVPVGIQDFFAQLLNVIGKRSDYFASCVTCEHWQKERIGCGGGVGVCDGMCDGTCLQQQCGKFKAMPPPEVIVDGCEHYQDNDEIPF